MRTGRRIASLLLCLAALLLAAPQALAAPPTELTPTGEEELRFALWLDRMDEITALFQAWSIQNGVIDGKGYCTTDGAPFPLAAGDPCSIGNVTQAMRRAGVIDYSVTGGWSCNGFARFALRTLYGRTLWRSAMKENVYTMSILSTVGDVRRFLTNSEARIGDMLCIMGMQDFDGDGKLNDEYWHYMIYISSQEDGVLVLDGNFDHDNSVRIHVVPWEFIMARQWIYLYHRPDKDYRARPLEDAASEPRALQADPDWTFLTK